MKNQKLYTSINEFKKSLNKSKLIKEQNADEILDILTDVGSRYRIKWQNDWDNLFLGRTQDRGPRIDHGGGEDGDDWMDDEQVLNITAPYRKKWHGPIEQMKKNLADKGIKADIDMEYNEKGFIMIHVEILNNKNESFKVEGDDDNNISKLTIILDSPYKWGKGWTGSVEVLDELNEKFGGIVAELGMIPGVNEYGVIIGEDPTSTTTSAYMHPSELVFGLTDTSDDAIENIKKIVEKYLKEMLPTVVSIKNVNLIPSNI